MPHLPPGLALAWGVTSPSRRGPKPAHSIQEIVQAALELADAEGIAALSMPRIAARVGVTTNALYRYVSSKDELLVLLIDAAWAPPPASIRQAATWREAAAAWTRGLIDGYRARPWLLDLPIRGVPMTPRLLRWVEALLEALAGTGLGDQEQIGCAMLLDGYARSIANLARNLEGASRQPGQAVAVREFLQPLLRERGFPILASMLSTGAYDDEGGLTSADLDFGLDQILNGIEVLISAA